MKNDLTSLNRHLKSHFDIQNEMKIEIEQKNTVHISNKLIS